MDLKNGYKVLYEVATSNKRTFYATKTTICDPAVDTQIGEIFTDADYKGKVIYEYKGKLYVANGIPAYGEDGIPTDECLAAFDELFVKVETTTEEDAPAVDVEDTIAPDTETEDDETSVETEGTETSSDEEEDPEADVE